jgi:hypothetical protein
MALSSEQVNQIAKNLNYEYWEREYLTTLLNARSSHYGSDWDDEVTELLDQLTDIDTQISQSNGDVTESDIVGQLSIKYQENRTAAALLRAKKSKILAGLFRVIEIYPRTNSTHLIR